MVYLKFLLLSVICGQLPLFQCNPESVNHVWQRRFKLPQVIKNTFTRDPNNNLSSYTLFPPVLSRMLNLTSSSKTNSKTINQQNITIEGNGDKELTNVTKTVGILKTNAERNSDFENGTINDELKLNMTGIKNPALLPSRRLTLAKQATIEEYPYVVSIQKDGQHWCAGAILNTQIVITTASCVWNSEVPSTMKVRAGSRNSDHSGQLVGIQDIVKHPQWNLKKAPDFDVALVMMDKALKFSHGIHSVELPKEATEPPFFDAWVTSWGADRPDGEYQPSSSPRSSLQVYHALLVERDTCNKTMAPIGVNVTDNFICLAQTGGKGPCTRDTGAPAVSDGVVWGLASWGKREPCGTEERPAVFAYVASAANLDFIKRSKEELMSRIGFDLV